jgi:hypothetical protein
MLTGMSAQFRIPKEKLCPPSQLYVCWAASILAGARCPARLSSRQSYINRISTLKMEAAGSSETFIFEYYYYYLY